MVTTIQVSDDLWENLNKRKKRGETFEDVINRMMLEEPEIKKRNKK
jgi:predicted CopG family antitoxin